METPENTTELITKDEYDLALSIVKKHDKQRQMIRFGELMKPMITLPLDELKLYIKDTEDRIKSYTDMITDMHKNKDKWQLDGFDEFKAHIREELNRNKSDLKDFQDQAYWAKIYDNTNRHGNDSK